jgi:hypothetical protein
MRLAEFNMRACGWNKAGLRCLYVIGLSLLTVVSSRGGQIKSDDFVVAMGASAVENPVWTREDDESNAVAPGPNFELGVDLEGEALSPSGPTFRNGKLENISGMGVVAKAKKFIATVVGKYIGPAPADAANPPNYRVQVNVSEISIHAAVAGDGSIPIYKLNFNEVTGGQEQSQKEQPLEFRAESFSNLSNYTRLSWTPKSWPSTAGGIDQEQGRIFDLTESEPDSVAIDGFEIRGNIVLLYDSKKE